MHENETMTSHRQWGVHADLYSSSQDNFLMNHDILNGRSILIESQLSAQQKIHIENGLAYSYFHKVPTQKAKVNYFRATIKGNVTRKPTPVMEFNDSAIFLDKNMAIGTENPNFEEIHANEADFIHLNNNFAATLFIGTKLLTIVENFELKEKSLESLNEGDIVLMVKELPAGDNELISPEKARFLMVMAGDGHVTKDMSRIFITSGDKDILENFSELTLKLYNKKAKKEGQYSEVNSVEICRELAALNLLSAGKINFRIPKTILGSNKQVLLSALGGLIDTDGNIYPQKGQLRIDTTYYNLAVDVASLLMKLGIYPSINRSKSTYGVRAMITKSEAKMIGNFVFSERKRNALFKIENPKKSRDADLMHLSSPNGLAEIRKLSGYTLESLGKKIGANFKLLSDWERGIRKPQINKLRKIAEICQNENLLRLLSGNITTAKIKRLEKISFDAPRTFLVPKSNKIFVTNFILTKYKEA